MSSNSSSSDSHSSHSSHSNPSSTCSIATVSLAADGTVSAVSGNLLTILAGCGIDVGTTPTFEAVFSCLNNAGLDFVTIFPRAGVAGGVALFLLCG
ncbi:hypothetical protein [Neobacillus bataviensis]|uniref:hypothetical protein n=1 Tax=Neobacillus bataviensis TaxID=220685 RepID=UPI001CC15AE8|nr:hypothetical protein [Neobacillus bataviensis]